MSEALMDILTRMESLTQKERAELAYAALRSLQPGEEEGVDEAWNAELSRRVAEIRAGTAVGKPAEQLFAELRELRP